jgi:hypothetical protein
LPVEYPSPIVAQSATARDENKAIATAGVMEVKRIFERV